MDAKEIIENFEMENSIEKREAIFNVSAEFRKGDLVLVGETNDNQLKNKLVKTMVRMMASMKVVLWFN